MQALAEAAKVFIGLFQKGGEQFTGYVTGIIPTLVVLLTCVNAIIKLVGEERVQRVAKKATKNFITRYTVFPLLADFFLTNPMAYTFGQFVEEKYKPAFYDSAVSFCHPITGLFPHANAGELFVYMGIATGITKLGLNSSNLAIRYFIVGLIVIFIRGVVTERITAILLKRNASKSGNSDKAAA
ncbi:MAG: PTS system glucitol/sorbitol-specific EIIC component [Eubacteriales bacterium]|jgi:glucitol/sorbitol PTS system EIIC component